MVVNVLVIIVMWLTGHADLINPTAHGGWEACGLLFPFPLVANLLFLLFWLLFHWRAVWLPLAGFLLCFPPIQTYLPLHPLTSTDDVTLKIVSYNVMSFGTATDPDDSICHIADYIAASDADLVCLQEAASGGRFAQQINDRLFSLYPYREESRRDKSDVLLFLSKHPIRSSEIIDYESTGNLSVAYVVNINGQDALVVNNHLESNHLTKDEKQGFSDMVKGELPEETAKQESRLLFHKLAEGAHARGAQADSVARYVREHRREGMSVFIAGDFNEQPISYACRTIGRDLTNCYVAAGNGPGFSYHHHNMYVRIDHLFCSDDWEPVACRIDRSIAQSDHYPLVCWLKKH